MRISRTVVWAILGCSLSLALTACGQETETGGGEDADASGAGPTVVAPAIDTGGTAPSRRGSSRFTIDVASSDTADAGTSTEGPDAGASATPRAPDMPWETERNIAADDASGSAGDATAGASSCPDGSTDCDGTCVDLRTHASHCGSCGRSCGDGETCRAGQCVCGAGRTPHPATGACIDLQTDPRHCGSFDKDCRDRQTCRDGTCVCRDGLSLCGGHCVDTSTHPDHCGDCTTVCGLAGGGRQCFDGECRSKTCATFGDDVRACAPHERQCVREANMQSNPLHCGACNNVCPAGQVCVDGTCKEE